MKIALTILAAGLLALFAVPTASLALQASYPVEIDAEGTVISAAESIEKGPVRDPNRDPAGPHDIIYDNGEPQFLCIWPDHWSKIRFTPQQNFELRAVRLRVYNPNANNRPINLRVYRLAQNNNLGDMVVNANINQFPSNAWFTYELAEDDYVRFAANEHFAVIFGRAPGGNPDQGGQGWWILSDNAGDNGRNQILQDSEEPAVNNGLWTAWDAGAMLVRANGEYSVEGMDLGVSGFSSTANSFSALANVENNYSVTVTNSGGENAEGFLVTFWATDVEGRTVWTNEVVGEALNRDETVQVVTGQPWMPENGGHYVVHVEVAPFGEDVFPENNALMFEQVVFNPEQPDVWLGYSEGEIAGTNWRHEDGLPIGVLFEHPGNDVPIAVKGIRASLIPAENIQQGTEVELALFKIANQRISEVWRVAVPTPEEGGVPQWVSAELDEEDYVTMWAGEFIVAAYIYSEDIIIRSDEVPPVTGAHPTLEPVSMYFYNNQWYLLPQSDLAIEIQVTSSDEVLPGAYLRIIPPTLDFGYELALNEHHTVDAHFISYGSDPVQVNSFLMTGAAQRHLVVSQNTFTVESQDTVTIQVSFFTDEDIGEFNGTILVRNNSVNIPSFMWPAFASTRGSSVNESVKPGIPQEFALSQNHPNPFNATTTIEFALTNPEHVFMGIYDMNGRLVLEAINNNMSTGYHSVTITAGDLPAGIYMYRLTAGSNTAVRKMVFLK